MEQTEQIVKKKKRKYEEKLLLLDYNCLSKDEAIDTVAEIRKKLLKIFRSHIGKENSITPYQLFIEIFSRSPYEMDVFMRNYWWNIIKTILSNMRTEGTLFVVNQGRRLFVLQTIEESTAYKKGIDRHIEALNKTKIRADEWVNGQKWKEF